MNGRFAELRLTAHAATLRGCSMFTEMTGEELNKLASIVEVQAVPKGSYVFHEGDPARGFFVVRTGAISVHRVSADGAERVLHVFRQGQSFAEGAFSGPGTYPADARAVENAELLLVPKDQFIRLIRTNTELALRMLASMSQHLRLLVNALEDLQGKDVETRLINWLLKRCPAPHTSAPVEIALDVTKSVLAAELSTRNETLSRALARLRDAGQIEVAGKRIRVLAPERLAAQFRTNLGEGN